MKTLFSLFWSFLKIGLFTFGGGYAMIPLIQREVVDRRGWVKSEDFLELLTLAQSAPGPISLNSAVFVGYSLAGYAGAIAAILGVVLPSFVIILLIAMYLADFRTNRYVDAAFRGMRPAVVALIAAPVIGLARGLGVWKIAAAIAAAAAVSLLGVSPMWFIAGGAAAGIIYAFYNKKGMPENKGVETAPVGNAAEQTAAGDKSGGETEAADDSKSNTKTSGEPAKIAGKAESKGGSNGKNDGEIKPTSGSGGAPAETGGCKDNCMSGDKDNGKDGNKGGAKAAGDKQNPSAKAPSAPKRPGEKGGKR